MNDDRIPTTVAGAPRADWLGLDEPKQRWIAFAIFAVIFAASYVHRPFLLGFYGDDFETYLYSGSLPEPQRFQTLWNLLVNRLPQIPALYLGYLVFGLEEQWAQVYCALLTLANALVLFGILRRLARGLDTRNPDLCAALALAAWIVAPWSLGYTAWVSTASVNLTGQLFVLWSLLVAMRMPAASFRWLLLVTFLHFIGCWAYEVYYGEVVWLALIAVVARPAWVSERWNWVRVAGAFFAGQALALFQNRLMIYLGLGNHKTFADWYMYFYSNLFSYPPLMLDAFHETYLWVKVSFICLVVLALGTLLFERLKRPSWVARHLALIVVCCAAVITNLAVLSLGGRGYFPHGIIARTTIAGTTFGAIIVLALVSLTVSRWRLVSWAGLASVSVLIGALWIAQQYRTVQWHQAYLEQQRLVALVPVDAYRRLPPDAFVLFLPPHYLYDSHGRYRVPGFELPIFATGYDFGITIERRIAVEEGRPFRPSNRPQFFPALENAAQVTWDGEKINLGGYDLRSRNLWVWDPATRTFGQAGLGLRIERGVLITLGRE